MRKACLIPVLAIALGISVLAVPSPASAQVAVGISIRVGPPALPVYAQPLCPGPDYIWTPGYWAYGPDGYYWVPGTWVLAPEPGLLWTPGWWGFGDGVYVWHRGYWGPHIGFYGGINYGFGYFGTGFVGGEWRGDHFYYNQAVTRVNVTEVHNVYVNRTVVRNVYVNNRVSYNGGPHGVNARPTAQDQRWQSERRIQPTAVQEQHFNAARDNPRFRYSENHGRPNVAATQRPGEFSGRGNERSNGNQFHPPQNRNQERPNYNERGNPHSQEQARPHNQQPRGHEGNGNNDHGRDDNRR